MYSKIMAQCRGIKSYPQRAGVGADLHSNQAEATQSAVKAY